MNVSTTTFQAVTNIAGVIFILVTTAGNFTTFHKENRHIDSAVQVLAVAKNDKIIKILPVLMCIFTVTLLEAIALVHPVSAQEPFHRTFIRNYKFQPRSPPVTRNHPPVSFHSHLHIN